MPLYEYECPKGHRFEMFRPIDRRNDPVRCLECRQLARHIMSLFLGRMGFKWLKDFSDKSPPAPEDAGYHPDWDKWPDGSISR